MVLSSDKTPPTVSFILSQREVGKIQHRRLRADETTNHGRVLRNNSSPEQ